MERYYLNLVDGLRRAGIPYHSTGYRYAARHQDEVVGVIGKGHVLRKYPWRNPIVFGPAVFSHPLTDLDVFRIAPIRKVLVSCHWLKKMYQPHLSIPVAVWPSGVDTYTWQPNASVQKDIDVIVYDKVRWDREHLEKQLIFPIISELHRRALRYKIIRYGAYREDDYRRMLLKAHSMIFLVEHETQGFAYLQALATGVPLLAWDTGGYWRDPEFYPDRIKYSGVSAVPYWDSRCGSKFADVRQFSDALDPFLERVACQEYRPRDYVLENLSLEAQARAYLEEIDSTVR
jgi:hypothetical protein